MLTLGRLKVETTKHFQVYYLKLTVFTVNQGGRKELEIADTGHFRRASHKWLMRMQLLSKYYIFTIENNLILT